MLTEIFLTAAPVLCVAIGLYYMVRIGRQIRPLLRRLDELKRWEDKIAAWELERAMLEGERYVKLEPEGRRKSSAEDEDLPF